MSVVTKSGTNQYHGALWEFLRNEVMDARGYFESTLPPLRQNQYGASVGGPVSIPKLYNGKNRTFFYAAWEGFQFRSAMKPEPLRPTDASATAISAPWAYRSTIRRRPLTMRQPLRTRARVHRRHYPQRPDQSDLGAFPDTHPAGRPVGEREQPLFVRTSHRPTRIRERSEAIRTSATITRSCFATASSIKTWQTRHEHHRTEHDPRSGPQLHWALDSHL